MCERRSVLLIFYSPRVVGVSGTERHEEGIEAKGEHLVNCVFPIFGDVSMPKEEFLRSGCGRAVPPHALLGHFLRSRCGSLLFALFAARQRLVPSRVVPIVVVRRLAAAAPGRAARLKYKECA